MRMDLLEKFNVADQSTYFSTKDGVLFGKRERILINYPLGKKVMTFLMIPI